MVVIKLARKPSFEIMAISPSWFRPGLEVKVLTVSAGVLKLYVG